jgi:hypothetical protein
MTRPAGAPDAWSEHVKLMFDLQVLAVQADLTRVWTFLYAREATSINFPHLGISMGHHESRTTTSRRTSLTRSRKSTSTSRAVCLLSFQARRAQRSGGTLLDHSLILYGSNLSVPTSHSQRDLPIIIAGGAAGRIKGGRYIALPGDETPLTNLYLTMLEKAGVPVEKLGDSTGRFNRLEV